MKNEATERAYMGAEDANIPDIPEKEEEHPHPHPHPYPDRERQPLLSSWDMYYDESYDPPVPWWLNSATGESTWDCPTTQIPADPGELHLRGGEGGDIVGSEEGGGRHGPQLATAVVVIEPDDAATASAAAAAWVQQWSEEHQVRKKNKQGWLARYVNGRRWARLWFLQPIGSSSLARDDKESTALWFLKMLNVSVTLLYAHTTWQFRSQP